MGETNDPLAHSRAIRKPTLRLVDDSPASPNPNDLIIGPPDLLSPTAAYHYGLELGRSGIDLRTGQIPLELVDWAREGHRSGLDERVERALLESAPADNLIVEGIAPWAVLPSPVELAAGLRALLAKIDDEDAVGELARAVLENAAQDIELFAARSFAELQAREFEMAEAAFDRGPCPACCREAR